MLLKLANYLLWSMERKNVTALIALDISATFDTFDHRNLLTTLNRNFDIDGMALKWIRSYLAARDMKIKIREAYLERKELTFLVLEGSCLGANFFNMYCNTISKILDPNLGLIAFVNDHAIIKEFNPNKQAEEIKIIYLLRTT